MARSLVTIALIAAAVPLGATVAGAQFNPFSAIFGSPPPRPPSNVPGARQQIGTPPPGQPAPGYPAPYGGVQSHPLPPPPDVAQPNSAQPPLAGLPPSPPRPLRPAVPFEPGPPPSDGVIAEPPAQKITNTAALFSGLGKITGRILNFDGRIGGAVPCRACPVR